jgi:two-component system, NarL family, sensor histidine kinase DegS
VAVWGQSTAGIVAKTGIILQNHWGAKLMANEEKQAAQELTAEDFLQELNAELEQTLKELKEMDVLIKQSSTEVDKLSQRNAQIGNKMRQVEANFETYPREDIKNVYVAAQESQMRLFMMRSQVEQLQNKQTSLQKYVERLRGFINFGKVVAPTAPTSVPGALDSNQSIIVRIIEAQENERQHLARQMHDGPAQSLSNLILLAEICERLLEQNPDQARTELKNLKNAVNTTFQKTRSFIFDLRPMMLDDLGLVPTLRRYVQDFEAKAGCQASLNAFGDERRFAPHNEVIIFRAVQALLYNVQRHAQATHAQVTLDTHGEAVSVTVEDDGSGFDVEEVLSAANERKALGLSSIREQVQMLGGTFQVESRIGRGTKVQLSIPAA